MVERNERSECSETRGGRRRAADVAAAVLLGDVCGAILKQARRRPEARRGHFMQLSLSNTKLLYLILIIYSIDQFSILSPSILSNSSTLFVTKTRSLLKDCAANNISIGPIILPSLLSFAFNLP